MPKETKSTDAKPKKVERQAKRAAKREAKAAKTSMSPPFKHIAKKKLSTGKGATPAEIGRSLVDLFNTGKSDEVEKRWHHKKIESIEGDGTIFLGRKGIAEKNAWWYGAFEVHSAKAEGPFVGATGFTVHFTMETSPRSGDQAGVRSTAREVGVYTVAKGKIIREEFMGRGD